MALFFYGEEEISRRNCPNIDFPAKHDAFRGVFNTVLNKLMFRHGLGVERPSRVADCLHNDIPSLIFNLRNNLLKSVETEEIDFFPDPAHYEDHQYIQSLCKQCCFKFVTATDGLREFI